MEKNIKKSVQDVFNHNTKAQEAYLFADGNVFTDKYMADNYKRELNERKQNNRYNGEINYEVITRAAVCKAENAEAEAEASKQKQNAEEWLTLKKVEEIEAENYKKLVEVGLDLGLEFKKSIKKSDLSAILVSYKKELENAGE